MAENGEAPKPRRIPSTNPTTLFMVVEAIGALQDRKGASVQAIKGFILDKYPTVDPASLKNRLKKAIQKGLDNGTIIRPKNSDQAGASLNGRFKLDKTKMAAEEKAKKAKVKKDAEKDKVKKKTAKKDDVKSKAKKAKVQKAPETPVKAGKKAPKTPKKTKKATDQPKKPKAKKMESPKTKTPKKTPSKKTPKKTAAKKTPKKATPKKGKAKK